MQPSNMRSLSRPIARALRLADKAVEAERLKINSARVSVLLTFCPPGPEDREKRHPNSVTGIETPGVKLRWSLR